MTKINMDQNHLRRLSDITSSASTTIGELQKSIVWYQSALAQKTAWGRRMEAEAVFWKQRAYLAFWFVIGLGATMVGFLLYCCTAPGFRLG